MRPYWVGLLFLPALLGCGAGSVTELDSPEQLTLFSIDGRDEERRGVVQAEEIFHGYPVLGKVEIIDPDDRKTLIGALRDGIARRPKEGAKCFWPRHAIRAVEKGRTVEYVICFECERFEEFLGDKKLRHESISRDVQPAFDKPLREAGVPIAPKWPSARRGSPDPAGWLTESLPQPARRPTVRPRAGVGRLRPSAGDPGSA